MGIEYSRFMVPTQCSWRPDPKQTSDLIDALRENGWLIDPSSPSLAKMRFKTYRWYPAAAATGFCIKTSDGTKPGNPNVLGALNAETAEYVLSWPVENLSAADLKYPLEPAFENSDDAYFDFELHFANDYVYPFVGAFDQEPVCQCGQKLVYYDEATKIDAFAQRIRRTCNLCGYGFDPTGQSASGQSGMTGEIIPIPNAATYRFALVVGCGKAFGAGEPYIAQELKELVERTLEVQTFEAASWH